MQFHVPQFIDVEDKIFGPFSAKQFAWIGGGAGAFFVAFSITGSFFLGLIFSSPFLALGGALAFYKINNRPFIYIAEAAFRYFTKSKLYIWKKIDKKVVPANEEAASEEIFVPKLSDSRLKDLAWSLDIRESDSIYSNKNQK